MFQFKRIMDEGTSSPFVARFYGGMIEMRNQLFLLNISPNYQNNARDHFDKKYKPLLEAAQAVRDSALEIKVLTSEHLNDVRSGKIINFRANQYDILKTIDIPLGQSIDKLINQSIVATKTCLQSILNDPLGLDIGFFFQNDKNFNTKINEIRQQGNIIFAQYLENARVEWHAELQELRTQQEHGGWSLEDIKYKLISQNKVELTLPHINGSSVDIFAVLTANRVLLFIENMMIYAMQLNNRLPIYVTEIPNEQRSPKNLERFRIVPSGFEPPWILTNKGNNDFI